MVVKDIELCHIPVCKTPQEFTLGRFVLITTATGIHRMTDAVPIGNKLFREYFSPLRSNP